MPRIKQTYILIGGFSINQPRPDDSKTIVLYRGNRHGEAIVKTLATFPAGTPYGNDRDATITCSKCDGVGNIFESPSFTRPS